MQGDLKMVRKPPPRQKNTSFFVQHCIVGERGAGFYFAPTGLTKNGFLVFYSTFDFSGLAPRTHHGFVRVAVEQIKKRAEAIFGADGDNILRD